MRCALAALTVLIIVTAPAGAQGRPAAGGMPRSSGSAFETIFQRLLDGVAKKDTVAVKRLLAPSYLFVAASGDTVLTREERLAAVARDTTGPSSYALQSCRTQAYGSAAVAHCRFTMTQRMAGADSTRELISTVVFVRQGSRWRVVATHPSFVTRQ